MKHLFLIIILFLGFTSAYALSARPVHAYATSKVNTISARSAFFIKNTTNACCKPDNSFPFDKGHFLLVLAGCGIGVFGLSKYADKDIS